MSVQQVPTLEYSNDSAEKEWYSKWKHDEDVKISHNLKWFVYLQLSILQVQRHEYIFFEL